MRHNGSQHNQYSRPRRMFAPLIASLALLAGCSGESMADAAPRQPKAQVATEASPLPAFVRPDQRLLPVEDVEAHYDDTVARFTESNGHVTTTVKCVAPQTIAAEDIPYGASATSLMAETLAEHSYIMAPLPVEENAGEFSRLSADGAVVAPHDQLSLARELVDRWATLLAPGLEEFNSGQPHADSAYQVAALCIVSSIPELRPNRD